MAAAADAVPASSSSSSSSSSVPWSPNAEACINRAVAEAGARGAGVTGSEHILYALLVGQEEGAPPPRIVGWMAEIAGSDVKTLTTSVVQSLESKPLFGAVSAASGSASGSAMDRPPFSACMERVMDIVMQIR